MPGTVISRFTLSSARREIPLDDLQVLAQTIDLARVAFDRQPLVIGQHLRGEPGAARPAEQVGRRARRDQVCMQDRWDDVLEPRAPLHDLIAADHLTPQRLGCRVRNPHLRQEAASVELGQHAGINRVGLDLGVRNDAHLLRVGDHDPLHVRTDDRGHRRRVAGRLDHHDIVLAEPPSKGLEQIASHGDTPESPELAVFPGHRLGKSAVGGCPVR